MLAPIRTLARRSGAKKALLDLRTMARVVLAPRTVTLHGVTLPVRNYMSRRMRRVLYSGSYEEAEARIVKSTLSSDDRVVEFGTGMGFVAALCSKRCGAGSVTTFEANGEMLELISETFGLNRVFPNLVHAAVSRSGAPVQLNITAEFWSSSTFRRKGHVRSTEVPGVPFEQVLHEYLPSFVVMDIEGGESDLISCRITDSVKKLLIELHEHVIGDESTSEVRRWLSDAGFQLLIDNGDRSASYWER